MPTPRVKPVKDETPKAAKKCAVTRKTFRENAKPIVCTLSNVPFILGTKEFASGTLGWFTNGSTVVDVGGEPVKVTYMVQAFVANSKDASEE